MSYEYIDDGLLNERGMRTDLEAQIREVAAQWRTAGIDPSVLEVASEFLARWASALEDQFVTAEVVEEGLGWLGLPETVLELVRRALPDFQEPKQLAAFAVHVLDIAERMAVDVFVAELPNVSAKSDRTAQEARRVGSARHLKG